MILLNVTAAIVAISSLAYFIPSLREQLSEIFDGRSLLTVILSGLCLWGVYLYYFPAANPNEMSRVLKLKFEDAEFALRKLLKEKQIKFYRRYEDEGYYQYEFPGRNLILNLYPYDSSISIVCIPPKDTSIITTCIDTLLEIPSMNAKNRDFAEELALAIDDLTIKPDKP